MPRKPRIHLVPRDAPELTETQIESLMDIGRREDETINAITDAVRAGSRERVWALAEALATLEDRLEDEARKV
jgi:hypothetical protein